MTMTPSIAKLTKEMLAIQDMIEEIYLSHQSLNIETINELKKQVREYRSIIRARLNNKIKGEENERL